ncbi:DUF3530 family protein [Algibacillus agarilyticus]|uniref:DUF3530 family protein n=1 Tax=Algibacillus agarilyticus TaxID=2234133 RepID=UPI000DD0963C|nr:DUF3530 family protein [Algibacillus agarilyticus]
MKTNRNISFGSLLLLLGLSFFISNSIAETKRSTFKSESQLRLDDFKRLAEPDEIIELVSGEEPFVVFKSEETTSFSRGTAILLPDLATSQVGSHAYQYLRHSLNEHGWLTLAADTGELASKEPLDTSELEVYMSRPDQSAEQLSEKYIKQQKLNLQMRITALVNKASEYPGINMVIAQGATAGYLTELYHDGVIIEPEIFVLIQPYLPDHKANKLLAKKIASLQSPILDIWSDYDNPWARATVESRKRFARKLLTVHYRQRQLFGDMGWEQRDARLTREIVGYIAYLGW